MSRKIEMPIPKPLVSSPVSALLSLILPGLGQILSAHVRRGLLFFGSLGSIIGLLTWRIHVLGRLVDGFFPSVGKAIDKAPFFTLFSLTATLVIWGWVVYDAYRLGQPAKEGSNLVFAAILIVFFSFGWQISEIDLLKLTADADEAWVPLSKILWPWEDATTRATDTVQASAKILIEDDSGAEAPAPAKFVEGEPYLKAEPNKGKLSELDDDNKIVPGTLLTLSGGNFEANRETQIWWKDSIGNEFRPRYQGEYVRVKTDAEGSFTKKMVMPYRLIPPSAKGAQTHIVMARQVSETGPLLPSQPLILTIELIIETIFMGMMATFFGIIFSIPISFLAARNLMSTSPLTLVIYYLTRTVLNIVRAIEPLIWALIAVVWVGLGPFAGIVALTIHSVAALGKLYSEAIEGINPGPIEAIQATGATKLQTIIYAVVPQMIPPFVSFSIYRWDINVRMSTVIGMVGGGGIGFLLVQYIRLLQYKSAGIAVWFIAITVAILDYVSAEIRQKFV
jgi:phosphonate transport system permease protein